MKKISLIIVTICIAFTFVYSIPTYKVQAIPFVTKAATTGIKKAVKEVIKESAFDAAVNIFLDEAFTMALEERQKYQAQQDYELFCGKKMPDLITCEKPMQAKVNLTAQDKANIGQQAELELEKLINGGKGFTRWQKFLDWIVPIWLVSVSLTAITYAIDPEVKSLFNEAGYNALVALGLIKPAESTEIEPITSVNLPPTPSSDVNDSAIISKLFASPTSTTALNFFDFTSISAQNIVTKIDLIGGQTDIKNISYGMLVDGSSLSVNLVTSGTSHEFWVTDSLLGSSGTAQRELTIALNGDLIQTIQHVDTGSAFSFKPIHQDVSILVKQINSVKFRTPYQVGGFWYTDTLYSTVDGQSIHFQTKTINAPDKAFNATNRLHGQVVETATPTSSMRLTVFKNISPKKTILTPVYEEIETELDLVTGSKYEKDGQVALIPPSAISHIQTSTGVQLTPEIDEETGEKKFTTPTGETVPDDDITVEEPNVQDNPSPEPNTVTPPATQTNPNPEPIPLTPTSPPTSPPTTGTPSPPPEDGGGGKPNIPLSLLIGLFKLLFAIIFYLVRLFTFIVTIQMIPPVPIPNPAFIWFTEVTILGIKPYSFIINTATFFLSFSIYKSIRRVFP